MRRAISGGKEGDGEWQGKIRMLGDASDIIWCVRVLYYYLVQGVRADFLIC